MYLKNGELHGTTTCLWEALTALAVDGNKREQLAYEKLQLDLGLAQCMSMQEIGITPTPEGWVIHVRACAEDGRVDILVPKNREIPVKILVDTRNESQPYERGN